MNRRVTASGKDEDGDITTLCNGGEFWSPRKKSGAISDIESGSYRYFVRDTQGNETDIKVVNGSSGKYLRTDPDKTSQNDLKNLPNC